MVKIYPVGWKRKTVYRKEPCDGKTPQFVIHPSTSELAEQLVTDPEALANENYSGIYDASGDYVPQYCDNPDEIPQGSMSANSASPTGEKPAESSAENVGPADSSTEASASSSETNNK